MNILFSFLFAFDVFLGFCIGYFFDIWKGIIAAAVLIFINAVTYRVILKIQKLQKEQQKTADKIVY